MRVNPPPRTNLHERGFTRVASQTVVLSSVAHRVPFFTLYTVKTIRPYPIFQGSRTVTGLDKTNNDATRFRDILCVKTRVFCRSVRAARPSRSSSYRRACARSFDEHVEFRCSSVSNVFGFERVRVETRVTERILSRVVAVVVVVVCCRRWTVIEEIQPAHLLVG